MQAAAEGGRFVYCRESGRGGGDDDHERALAGRERDAPVVGDVKLALWGLHVIDYAC